MKYAFTALWLLFLCSNVSAQVSQQQNQAAAAMAINFLDRTDIKGSEADVMLQVKGFLKAIATGQMTLNVPAPPAPPAPPAAPAEPKAPEAPAK